MSLDPASAVAATSAVTSSTPSTSPATASSAPATNPAAVEDFLPLLNLDHVEFWVGNAYQAARFYHDNFGFDVIAYAGPETGVRDRASYVLRQGELTFVMTAGLTADSPIVAHQARHGDGVRDIAFQVANADRAFEETTKRGARPVEAPATLEGQKGTIRRSAIAIYGDTIHSFVDRSNYHGTFAPGYHRIRRQPGRPIGFRDIDHIVGNVELGQMDRWVDFYRDVMGFRQLVHFSDEAISTEYSALMSKVMQNGTGRIKFPINEPAQGKKKSQIQEFLDYYGGPGAQHIALLADDIVGACRELRSRGIQFLKVPNAYYTDLRDRIGDIEENLRDLEELGILVDRDDEGYLLQIFTKPVQDRPTLFFELIQRHGAKGFGAGNFKALFEAIELEQGKRGNL